MTGPVPSPLARHSLLRGLHQASWRAPISLSGSPPKQGLWEGALLARDRHEAYFLLCEIVTSSWPCTLPPMSLGPGENHEEYSTFLPPLPGSREPWRCMRAWRLTGMLPTRSVGISAVLYLLPLVGASGSPGFHRPQVRGPSLYILLPALLIITNIIKGINPATTANNTDSA